MTCQLPADCLEEIFEYLEKNIVTLHSCLLVNRLWCQVSVRILWRNIWILECSLHKRLEILGTLVTYLPDESKDLLQKNGIFITTPTLKPPPLFNYASFCRALSVDEIDKTIRYYLEGSLQNKRYLLLQEILKLFMNQIPSLKELDYIYNSFGV